MDDSKKEQVRKDIRLKETLNDTSSFLLPCMSLSQHELFRLGFINCYLSDMDRIKINETDIHLYLLFKPNEEQLQKLTKKISLLEEQDTNNSVYIEDYNYEDGYIVLVLKFPDKFKKDYNYFIDGKYSKFSREFKELYPEDKIVEFVNEQGKIEKLAGKSFQWMVVYKDERIKKFVEEKYGIDLTNSPEYWHLPIIEKETLDINRIKKEVKEGLYNKVLNRK